MSLLGSATHTVTRYAAGSYVAHVWVPGASSTFSIVGTLLPLSGRELDRLPEAFRTRGAWRLICEGNQAALQIVSPDNATQGDRVTVDGRSAFVHAVRNLTGHTTGLPHRQYTLIEESEAGGDAP